MKALLAGAPIALMAGMLMGAAAKPDLSAFERPEGPQMLASVTDPQRAGPFADDGVSLAAYGGKVPDYVFGTDMTKASAIYPTAAVPPPIRTAKADEDADAPALQAAADLDDPAPAPSYPSVDGGQVADGTVLPPAPADAGVRAPA